ncbi:unnamed protein product, partial [Mesorhabditis spiculigera]
MEADAKFYPEETPPPSPDETVEEQIMIRRIETEVVTDSDAAEAVIHCKRPMEYIVINRRRYKYDPPLPYASEAGKAANPYNVEHYRLDLENEEIDAFLDLYGCLKNQPTPDPAAPPNYAEILIEARRQLGEYQLSLMEKENALNTIAQDRAGLEELKSDSHPVNKRLRKLMRRLEQTGKREEPKELAETQEKLAEVSKRLASSEAQLQEDRLKLKDEVCRTQAARVEVQSELERLQQQVALLQLLQNQRENDRVQQLQITEQQQEELQLVQERLREANEQLEQERKLVEELRAQAAVVDAPSPPIREGRKRAQPEMAPPPQIQPQQSTLSMVLNYIATHPADYIAKDAKFTAWLEAQDDVALQSVRGVVNQLRASCMEAVMMISACLHQRSRWKTQKPKAKVPYPAASRKRLKKQTNPEHETNLEAQFNITNQMNRIIQANQTNQVDNVNLIHQAHQLNQTMPILHQQQVQKPIRMDTFPQQVTTRIAENSLAATAFMMRMLAGIQNPLAPTSTSVIQKPQALIQTERRSSHEEAMRQLLAMPSDAPLYSVNPPMPETDQAGSRPIPSTGQPAETAPCGVPTLADLLEAMQGPQALQAISMSARFSVENLQNPTTTSMSSLPQATGLPSFEHLLAPQNQLDPPSFADVAPLGLDQQLQNMMSQWSNTCSIASTPPLSNGSIAPLQVDGGDVPVPRPPSKLILEPISPDAFTGSIWPKTSDITSSSS